MSYIFDAEGAPEQACLMILDRLVTAATGGPLAGLPTLLEEGAQILDVACGTGSWVLDVAFRYPHLEVAGIDISERVIEYANARARSQHLQNASFGVMDITPPLDFADGTFDMINVQFLGGVLKEDEWLGFLQESLRLLRSGGFLRITETDEIVTNSKALEQLHRWLLQVMRQRGYGFSGASAQMTLEITPFLPTLLRKAGVKKQTAISYQLNGGSLSPHATEWYRVCEVLYNQALFPIEQEGFAQPEELYRLYQQMLMEALRNDFSFMFNLTCIVGCKE